MPSSRRSAPSPEAWEHEVPRCETPQWKARVPMRKARGPSRPRKCRNTSGVLLPSYR